ncbi:S49 family peptidase [Lysobacter enzymogenes]|uniref:S49 family peptidase n=1 Tax=Lysobacter enzymogenes TaxID=69 RepID=UPI00099B2C9E|nr:S49 family peptidase [Lysobacter enzymogenes]UZW62749.1 S49 family peptidase [Lysobacter enzymogenes]
MIDAFNVAASRPWLIQQEALETIFAIAQRYGDPEALQTRVGRPLDNTRTVSMRDGVAVIPVTGPIFRYANLFTEISGATSTGTLASDIQSALDNKYVRGIVLDINSPGGEATGINELGKLIRSGRAIKPIKAYAGGSMASAAYWLGSAADEVIIDDTAALGSIGVLMSYQDTSARDEKSDVRTIEIVSSQSPDKRINPATDEGRAKVQSIVDALAEVFVSAVAANRGTTAKTVLADFGRGGVLIGAAAVKAGMADRIGSLESVIAELAGSASDSKRNTTMSTGNKGQVTVSSTEDLRNALAAGYTADHIVIASIDAAVAQARSEGEAAGRKVVSEDAVKAERARIAEIQALTREGFEAEAKAAIDNGDSPAMYALALIKAAQDRGVSLEAMRKDAPKAAAHAKPGDDRIKEDAKVVSLSPKNIFAARAQAAGGVIKAHK